LRFPESYLIGDKIKVRIRARDEICRKKPERHFLAYEKVQRQVVKNPIQSPPSWTRASQAVSDIFVPSRPIYHTQLVDKLRHW
jgi:hypothetical protein